MSKISSVISLVLLVVSLVLVRMFEADLFYDPLILFFKGDHSTVPLPEFDTLKLVAFMLLRFALNTGISLLILWVLFRKKEIIKISIILYGALFVVLLAAFLVLIQSSETGPHMALFYVRRFLIQPIFLLLLIPAFYFQKKS